MSAVALDSLPTTFGLSRVSGDHWLIQDSSFPTGDARHVVASLTEVEGEIEVVWMQTTPLHTRFLSADAALECFVEWRSKPSRGTRPIPIPHRAPTFNTRSRRAGG